MNKEDNCEAYESFLEKLEEVHIKIDSEDLRDFTELKKCKWCGKPFKKKHNRQMYCCKECAKEAEKEKALKRWLKWFYKHKKEMYQTALLGTSSLGQHREEDFNKEYKAIRKELKRLKLK